VKILTKDKQVLGILFFGYASIVYRNLTVLRKAGIDTAAGIKDWADWLAQSKKIKDSGFFASAKYLDFPWGHLSFYGGVKGAQMGLSPDGKSLTMDVSKYADALGFMKDFQSYSSNVSGSLLPNITRGEAMDFPQLHRREAQDRNFRYLPRGLALA